MLFVVCCSLIVGVCLLCGASCCLSCVVLVVVIVCVVNGLLFVVRCCDWPCAVLVTCYVLFVVCCVFLFVRCFYCS